MSLGILDEAANVFKGVSKFLLLKKTGEKETHKVKWDLVYLGFKFIIIIITFQ